MKVNKTMCHHTKHYAITSLSLNSLVILLVI